MAHRPAVRKSASAYFRGVPGVTAGAKTLVRKSAVRRFQDAGCAKGKQVSSFNDDMRKCFAEAIFEVEDYYESQGDGRPHHPVVVGLRRVRNRVYDDLGLNEYPAPDSPRTP